VVRASRLHGGNEVVIYRGKIDLKVARIWKIGGKPSLMFLTTRSLVRMLVDGHFQSEDFKAGAGTERGGERGVYSATNAYNKTFDACVLSIAFQPIRNMICRFL